MNKSTREEILKKLEKKQISKEKLLELGIDCFSEKTLERIFNCGNFIQAVLFALFHMTLIDKVKIEENIIISFFFSIITGVVYGNIKEKTGNLNWCIFFHSVYCFTFAFIGLIYIEFFAGMIEKVSKLRITEMRTLPYIFAISLVIFIWTLKKIGMNYYSLKGGEKYE